MCIRFQLRNDNIINKLDKSIVINNIPNNGLLVDILIQLYNIALLNSSFFSIENLILNIKIYAILLSIILRETKIILNLLNDHKEVISYLFCHLLLISFFRFLRDYAENKMN